MFVDSVDSVVSELFIKLNDIQALFINELRIKLEYEKEFLAFLSAISIVSVLCIHCPPQWEAADAEIKVPFGENTELKRYPFKAWSRSLYSHTCYAYCQGFLPCLFLNFRSIHLHFFQSLPRFFLCWLWLTHGSCVGPQNKIGHPAGCRFPC